MKNPGHKRSNSGYSQPTQSQYSQNSLLNTMIRVNKIGGVASNLDSSAFVNGNRPSISPYRKNSNSREATPKTAISRNSNLTGKSNENSVTLNNGKKFVSKTPPTQNKRMQSFSNLNQKNLNQNGVMNSLSTNRDNKGSLNLMGSFKTNLQNGFEKSGKSLSVNRSLNSNSLSNSIKNINTNMIFSKINNSLNTNNNAYNKNKNSNFNSQSNFYTKSLSNSLEKNVNLNNIISNRQIQSNNLRNSNGLGFNTNLSGYRTNRGTNMLKNGTKIEINNDNLNQKKFEKNLYAKNHSKNLSGNAGGELSIPLNGSFEKSSTNSFNSANDQIRVNKPNLQQHNNFNNINQHINNNKILNNMINNNHNNSSYNNCNSDVLSSLLNSKNYSKSPKRQSPSPNMGLTNRSVLNDLNRSPNNLNIFAKPNFMKANLDSMNTNLGSTNFSSIGKNTNNFSKINNANLNLKTKKNSEITQKQSKDKSKTPSSSPTPVNTSLNNLNVLKNLNLNKNILNRNLNNFAFQTKNNLNINNNISLKKVNPLSDRNTAGVNISVNKMNMINNKLKQNEFKGTLIEMNSEEFSNKLTGKFGSVTKESFYSGNNNNLNNNPSNHISRSNSNNNSQNNSNIIPKKEVNNFVNNNNGIYNNYSHYYENEDQMGLKSGNFNFNNNVNNNGNYNNISISKENKFNNNLKNLNKGMNINPNTGHATNDNTEIINSFHGDMKKGNTNVNNYNNNNNNLFPNKFNANNNENSASDIMQELKLKNLQVNNLNVGSFKDLNTSPFLKNKNNLNEKSFNDSKGSPIKNQIAKSNNNTSNSKSPISNNIGETRSFTPNPPNINRLSNSKLNDNRLSKESPMKANKSVDNILVPPKKLKKRILYMSDITKIGFSGQNNKKFNQDNFFIYKNFNNDPNSIYMSVCDGHGVHGHDVSGYLKENLPVNLSKNFIKKNISLSQISTSDTNLQNMISETFLNTNIQMTKDLRVDTNFSGSTCVSLIYTPTKLITINVGDSRAVLGRLVNGIWTSHDLSNDHKPTEPIEAARIKKCGGRIEPYCDDNNEFIGPPRVWLKEEDIPGLAMTRSFGDKIANIVGVTCEPEITEWELTAEDKFFIIASDGVWEFIESEESDHKGACEHLLKEASKRWMKVKLLNNYF